MKVEAFRFGSITIDGKKFRFDVLVYPDWAVDERLKALMEEGERRSAALIHVTC